MARYEKTKITSTKYLSNRKKWNTTIYDKVPERNDDIFVQTHDGDRFDLLAFKYYGNPAMWWYIAKANNKSFMNIEPGTIIRIPSDVKFTSGE